MRVAVIYHCPQTTGRLDDALADIGAEVERHYLDRGDPVPDDENYERVFVLGGAMGAYDSHLFSWLEKEKAWLAGLVRSDVPVLGLCLGAQLLAEALGGRAYRAEQPEVGPLDLALTKAGESHRVVSLARPVVYSLHQDTFTLPDGAELLAQSDRFPQAFSRGSALALQFHPDADLEQALSWGKEEGSILGAAGVEFDEYAALLEATDADLDRSSRAIFREWLR